MSKLKKILIKTKRQVFSEISGNNPSLFKGEGFDFMELREYTYGDDVRKIDWNVTAKMQKPYLKLFKEERELNVVIVSILNGSIHFGKKRLKQELVAEVASILAFSAIKNGDQLSSFIFTTKMDSFIKPTKNIYAVNKTVSNIYNFPSLGKKLNIKDISSTLHKSIKRKSIIFIIGDFFGNFDFNLLAKKHEIIAIIVRDKLEENPPEFGTINMLNPNTLTSNLLYIDSKSLKNYKKHLHNNDAQLYKHFRKNQIAFIKIYTDEEPFVKIAKLFLTR